MEIKKKDTPHMFDNIAESYDKMNHALSLNLDKRWRKKFVKYLNNRSYQVIADIACGTGDLLNNLKVLEAEKYYAIDPSVKMLTIADSKICGAEFINAYAENIPLNDNSVDLVTISFGIRNFSDLNKSFSEIHRIMRKDGIISIMEFSIPDFIIFRWGFKIYLKTFLPLLTRILGKDKNAYNYLKESILQFGTNVDVMNLLEKGNFERISQKNLALGGVKIYTCKKT